MGANAGRWCWYATVAGTRMFVIAGVLAIVAHALVPGMPIGAYMLVFIAADCLSSPIKPLLLVMRQSYRARRDRRPK